MEAHRKAMPGDSSSGAESLEKITYKVGNKVVLSLFLTSSLCCCMQMS